jgi:hypothetical protein
MMKSPQMVGWPAEVVEPKVDVPDAGQAEDVLRRPWRHPMLKNRWQLGWPLHRWTSQLHGVGWIEVNGGIAFQNDGGNVTPPNNFNKFGGVTTL